MDNELSEGFTEAQEYDQHVDRFAAVVRCVRLGATLAWTTDHAPLGDGLYSAGWLDVYVPALCGPAHLGWAWTIETDTPATEFELDENGERGPRWLPGTAVKSFTIVWPSDATAVNDNGDVVPAYTHAAIEEAMAAWCASIAYRPDITFHYDATLKTPFELDMEDYALRAPRDTSGLI